MSAHPKISVVMSAYNSEDYVGEAIDSILNQSFGDFEFVIINDGSTDRTPDILSEYQKTDHRIKVVNQENLGLTRSLNRGVKLAAGEYIARQDADDISEPNRLQKQLSFMEAHLNVAVVGCLSYVFNDDGIVRAGEAPKFRLSNAGIKRYLAKKNLFTHGSAMIRKSALAQTGLYREFFRHAQDYDLWLRLSEHSDLAILPEHLYRYRVTPEAASVARCRTQQCYAGVARKLHAERLATGRDSYDKLSSSHPDGLPVVDVPNRYDYHIFLTGEFLAGNNLKQARRQLRQAWKLGCRRPRLFYLFLKSLIGAGLLDIGRKLRKAALESLASRTDN